MPTVSACVRLTGSVETEDDIHFLIRRDCWASCIQWIGSFEFLLVLQCCLWCVAYDFRYLFQSVSHVKTITYCVAFCYPIQLTQYVA